jgi:hypothetical protein
VGVPLGPLALASAARFLASFLACFCSRRSRTALSRLSFAIVVFLFDLDAIHSALLVEFRARRSRASQSVRRSSNGEPPTESLHEAMKGFSRALGPRGRRAPAGRHA